MDALYHETIQLISELKDVPRQPSNNDFKYAAQLSFEFWDEIKNTKSNIYYSIQGELRYISLNRLVELCTNNQHVDIKLVNTLFVSYKSFTSPEVLLDKILSRLQTPVECPYLSVSQEEWTREMSVRIRLRSFALFFQWLDKYPKDWNVQMLYTLVDCVNQETHEQLKTSLIRRITRQLASRKQKAERLPLQSCHSTLGFVDMDFSNNELAKQFTLREQKMYISCSHEEFLSQRWNSAQRDVLAPNITNTLNWYDLVTNWVRSTILEQETEKDLVFVLSKFIKLGRETCVINNFSTPYLVVTALQSAPISRLKRIWEQIDEDSKLMYKQLSSLCAKNEDGALMKMALRMRNVNPPCVPHLDLYFHDLARVDVTNHEAPADTVNYAKIRDTVDIIRTIQQYQTMLYTIKCDPSIQGAIDNFMRYVRYSDMDAAQRRSLEIYHTD